ncbi:hypothetical protein HN51_014581 [Arachis hypogaea]|uniref:Protein ECERIFERUM n=1 Tax=Arachis hypogaea TaxID=3818 RepID=A0A445CNU7_ARAHY|nr:protein ECERIFERUM 2 [Arachis hypogaea]QHO45521.1 Protein ECERIFERUM [Arachis hypogaea]RYR52611.1 hypothetical protein Ahy_A06g027505 [Arachis hypogaea]
MASITTSHSPSLSVTLHSKLTAVSSEPTGSGKTHHELSALDRAMAQHTLHMVFYYRDQDELFGLYDLDSWRESLSTVLTMYPTMTGRLLLEQGHDGNWQVRWNDAGVRVVKGSVDGTLSDWLNSATASQEKLLASWNHMPVDPTTWSPFRIQVSNFKEGGVAIGISCSHMLADLTCLASFIKSWTLVHRNLPITNPPSFTPLPFSPPSPPPLSNGHAKLPPPQQAKDMAKATFKFSSSTMQQCLSNVHHICPNATQFDFLCALFWTRISHLKPLKNNDQTHSLSICIDLRKKLLKEPIPFGYFGNALHFTMLSLEGEDFGSVVSAVNRHLAGIEEEEIRCAIERLGSSNRCMYGEELTCVCMESLPYEAKFSDNEKPVHVSCHVGNVAGKGLIMVMPSCEEGLARTVTVMLPHEELAELIKDEAILQLDPTTLLSDI